MDMHAIMEIIDLIPLEDLFIINIDMAGLQVVGYTLGRLLFPWLNIYIYIDMAGTFWHDWEWTRFGHIFVEYS